MASKEVEFHEEARLEYEAAFESYFERSASVASRFAAELDRAFGVILEAPHAGPPALTAPGSSYSKLFPSR